MTAEEVMTDEEDTDEMTDMGETTAEMTAEVVMTEEVAGEATDGMNAEAVETITTDDNR